MNNSSFNLPDIEHRLEELDLHQPLTWTARIFLAVFLIAAFVVGTIGNITVLALFINFHGWILKVSILSGIILSVSFLVYFKPQFLFKKPQETYRSDIVQNIADIEHRLEELDLHQPLTRTARIFLAVFLIAAFVVGTIGNITVLALFIKFKSLRTTSNIFVSNLTAADLMMCIVCLPMLIDSYLRGRNERANDRFFCDLDAFLGAFSGFLSIWSLVCLAIDRCIVISRHLPVRYSSDKLFAKFVVAGIWLLAFAGAALPYIGFGQFVFKGTFISCSRLDYFSHSFSNMFYNIMLQVVYFLIPITCISVCYILIFVTVRNHEKRYFDARNGGTLDERAIRRTCRRRTLERNELKTAKAGFILISVFCFSWAPYSIVSWIGLTGNRTVLTPLTVTLPAIFAKVSTILNPLFYAFLLQSFKSKLALCCKQYCSFMPSSYGSRERTNVNPIHLQQYAAVATQMRNSPVTAV